MALLFPGQGRKASQRGQGRAEGLKGEDTSEWKAARQLERLKADTTPSFQFLALPLDLLAQDNDKCIEHISEFLIFSKGLGPRLKSGWKTENFRSKTGRSFNLAL